MISKSDLEKIMKLLQKESKEKQKWNNKNRDKCGHSNTLDSLGDKGWHQLFYNDGFQHGCFVAINEIEKLLRDDKK